MTIYVTGESVAARQLLGLLAQAGLDVRAGAPEASIVPRLVYAVTVTEDPTAACPTIDGVDSPFERAVVNAIAELSPSGRVLLQRGGGVQDDRAMAVTCPPADTERAAVVTGLFRAFRALGTTQRKRAGWMFWAGRAALAVLVLVASSVALQARQEPLGSRPLGTIERRLFDLELQSARYEALLIDRDRVIAELQLTARALRVEARLRALLRPPADSVLDLHTGTFQVPQGASR